MVFWWHDIYPRSDPNTAHILFPLFIRDILSVLLAKKGIIDSSSGSMPGSNRWSGFGQGICERLL
ncbi:hypothetical protein NC652_014934 [Populus alba x Populus x berolinensis]|uniref:Uncharacterized protein n=1 Tax=Populus alba x Populus x berolinensis TaxID=444605 RepID=A0AAD6QY45_9ROSI|nr:hypothetical protein NC652_014934 [Populus alba x Populus x berolinensis]KAJ6998860.1 hypothetical protein NC653_014882 [Populus alba x Populus x berolinensis]